MNRGDLPVAAGAETAQRRERRRRKAPVAALLSFFIPGAGQLYNRQRRLAAFLAVPFGLVILLGGVIVVIGQSWMVPWLLDIRIIGGLIALNLLLLAWRCAAIIQAHWYRANFGFDRPGSYATLALILITVGMHAVPTWYGAKLMDTLSSVALEGYRGSGSGLERFPGFVGPSGEPLPAPSREPRVELGERVNFLLVGLDSAPDRDQALTDTMLVLSINPNGSSAMISLPRDLVDAPLPNGDTYPHKLNSLLQAANERPDLYPFGGVGTLKATVAELLGAPIDYIAAVDMAGFQQLVDAIGGIEITLDRPVEDPSIGWSLPAGPTVMNGEVALRFVRARYGAGDNDFVRAGRQQQLLTAIRLQLARTNLLTALPGILDAVKNTIATDVPSDRMAVLAQAIQNADVGRLTRTVIEPPEYVTPATGDGGAYVLIPDLARIRELGRELIGG